MPVQLHEIKTISQHESYHGWPTIARLDTGELLVVSSSGRERHVCPFGQVHLMRSADDGATWSGPEVLANGPLDDRDAGILQTSKGTVLVNWFTSVAWKHKLEAAESSGREAVAELGDGFAARCQKIRSLLTEEVVGRELGTWMVRSTDGGKTWSPKYDCRVGSPHGPTQLSDGRLLYVGNANDPQPNPGSPYAPGMSVAESRDDGQSWQRIGEIPVRAGDLGHRYHEPHAVQAADGRIVVHIRNHNDADKNCLLQSESDDGGKTFTAPHNTGLLGFPAHLMVLRDGRLLTTYSHRVLPSGIRAAISEDHGRTWSAPMILDEKDERRDLGYPATVELDNGQFVTVWYERLPGNVNATVQTGRWSIC